MSSLHYLTDNDIINKLSGYVKDAVREKSIEDARTFHHENLLVRKASENYSHQQITGTLDAIKTFLKKQFQNLDVEWCPGCVPEKFYELCPRSNPREHNIILSVRSRVNIFERTLRRKRKIEF